ncbi:hypothetical protein PR048_002272 [Dryococelus australis]|uniref:Transposase n=1 Tax=Dryococelus australis TaxID=614101 RepID=A0ABQ9IJQ8_9NEOP|nr:hypothetical protein PR048_002272 [Dryococelus australis]
MKHGFSSTVQKQNTKVKNGTLKTLLHHNNLSISKLKIKLMFICFLITRGSCTWNSCIMDELSIKHCIGKSIRPAIRCTWMLHHDSVTCHTTISVNEFLAERNLPVIPQSPYSPDLSPCDLFVYIHQAQNPLESAILALWITSNRAKPTS